MKLRSFLPLLLISALITGCATNKPEPQLAGGKGGLFCDVADPINPSRKDRMTDGTKVQILDHNEYGKGACGWTNTAKGASKK